MKKQFLLVAVAVACTSAHAGSASDRTMTAVKALSSSDVKTELMGFDSVNYGGQEIRVAVTKETDPRGAYAYCRQYVQSYSHEIAPSDQGGSGTLPVDKTTIVLGNECKWTKG